MSAVRQLRSELEGRAVALAAIAGPEAAAEWPRTIAQRAGELAAQLTQDYDDRLAAQTATDVMCALWPDGVDPPHEWWHSPLGRLVARSVGREDAETVSHSVAAAMLGVHRGTVAQLVHRGTLDRHPDGGVLRSSVMQRLAGGRDAR